MASKILERRGSEPEAARFWLTGQIWIQNSRGNPAQVTEYSKGSLVLGAWPRWVSD